MRSILGLVCLVAVAVGCGTDPTETQSIESIGAAAESATVSSAPAATETPSTSAPSQATLTTATDATLAPTGEPRVIETDLGQVRYTLPPASTADPRPVNPPPEFVIGSDRRLVENCCALNVVVQNLEPPMATAELADSFEANGIQWETYDTGPQDGTELIARGTLGPITVLVSAQRSTSNATDAEPSLRAVVEEVARSLVIDPIDNG